MAVPRNRHSNARKNKRRAHHAKEPIQSVNCFHCSARKLPHLLCPSCGHYGPRLVVNREEE